MTKNQQQRKDIHTKLSQKHYQILEKYKFAKDKEGNYLFGNKASKVLEFALELLESHLNPQINDLDTLSNRILKELNMVTVGKPTFLAYISGDYEKAYTQNVAIDVIEWFLKKPINQTSLEEILTAIQKCWSATHYFYNIDFEIDDKGIFRMYLYHDFHSKQYSEFWGKYFSILLKNTHNCNVEYYPRINSLILRIEQT
ncbi:MAG: hypothetical protein ACTSRZ_08745 [Promethearchaeota archaeon]